MITVMFPTGVRVTYNSASYLIRSVDGWHLYTEKDGKWIASIQPSAGVIVESVYPCMVTAPPIASLDAAVDTVLKLAGAGELGSIASYKVKDLKRVLRRFNGRSGVWK